MEREREGKGGGRGAESMRSCLPPTLPAGVERSLANRSLIKSL